MADLLTLVYEQEESLVKLQSWRGLGSRQFGFTAREQIDAELVVASAFSPPRIALSHVTRILGGLAARLAKIAGEEATFSKSGDRLACRGEGAWIGLALRWGAWGMG